ncbi:ABC transporter ATP-binding protein [Halobacteriales archaeon QH_10_65_19]|jgi:branched-chain amino acid transport system ATP-binding protein|nr:MAG: ABC transporter ATP-binding protein [Halobacteriales archaeon QH_10_65_19]
MGAETHGDRTAADEPTDGEAILRTENVRKEFGNFAAIDDVTVSVERGEFRSIIGPNGAGKTTLFDLISGALPVTGGAVYFDGEAITDLPPQERIRRGMARSFQISNIFDGLTVRENVRLAAQALHCDEYGLREALFRPTDRYKGINADTDRILDRIGLAGAADEQAASLPYGDKRRLEIGVVLATEPELVLFDEPTAGMSPEETHNTIDLIEEVLVDQTLVLVEHDIELVMDLSDRITVLHRGEVLSEGTPDDIAADQDVRDAYLGGMT